METNLRFNIDACYNFIEGIRDVTVVFETKAVYDEESDTRTYISEPRELKSVLIELMSKCKSESRKEEHEFLKWLRGRGRYWKAQKYQVVGSLDDMLEIAPAEDKAALEKKRSNYLAFYRPICKLIEMIIHDVRNNSYGRMARQSPADNNKMLPRQDAGNFDMLFNDGLSSEPYYNLLRAHEYPLLGAGYNYVSKALKSGFCIWIYELQRQQVIEHRPDKVYAKLLLNTISGLKTFDQSIFRKTNNKAELLYKEYFEKGISQLIIENE